MKDDALYRNELLEYYKNPQNKRSMKDPTINKKDSNPLCGDEIEVFIKTDKSNGQIISDISFEGRGCVVSQAVASMLLEHLEGKNLSEIKNMTREDLLKMVGLELTPTRLKCAMLSLNALKKGILEYESDKDA